jgi:sugar O-acyltransferase (sialic acid O-acetyltransferase NeuD family)
MLKALTSFLGLSHSKPIGIYGAGGHGRSTLSLIKEVGSYKMIGYFDDYRSKGISSDVEYEILGKYFDAFTYDFRPECMALGIGYSLSQRRELFELTLDNGMFVPVLMHPSAIVDAKAQIGLGVQIHAGAILRAGSLIGKNTIINTGAILDHDNTVGEHSSISPCATLCGTVKIGDYSFIGAGAVILPDISVGNRSVVGAGAVVTKDVPDMMMCVGNPGRNVMLSDNAKKLIGGF